MLLTYSFPEFEVYILGGRKLHTLRLDPKRRWRAGMSIQHWMGSPRNTRAAKKPYAFAAGTCVSVQEAEVHYDCTHRQWMRVYVAGRLLTPGEVERLAYNDGLTVDEFRDYFAPCWDVEQSGCAWKGRIIHFTDLRY